MQTLKTSVEQSEVKTSEFETGTALPTSTPQPGKIIPLPAAYSLLSAINRLKSEPINHHKVDAAREEAFISFLNSGSNSITVIVGAPKAGTTILARKVVERISEHYSAENGPYASSPALYLNLERTGVGEFNFKNLDFQICRALNAPFYTAASKANSVVIPCYEKAGPLLREAAHMGLKQREIKALVLDHGQHLVLQSGGPSLGEQIERLISMGIASDLHVILIIDYGTFQRLDVTARLSASINFVHLPRYHWTDEKEVEQYKQLLGRFHRIRILVENADIPAGVAPAIDFALEDIAFEIYKSSFGLVGLTKELLVNTLARARAKKVECVKKELFLQLMDRGDRLRPLALQICAVERDFAQQEATIDIDQWLSTGLSLKEEKTSPNRRKEIGRAPGRDPVGIPPEYK